jgi:hypothetical protein
MIHVYETDYLQHFAYSIYETATVYLAGAVHDAYIKRDGLMLISESRFLSLTPHCLC